MMSSGRLRIVSSPTLTLSSDLVALVQLLLYSSAAYIAVKSKYGNIGYALYLRMRNPLGR